MNTTVTSFSSDHSSWVTPNASRRGSIESVLSIQGKETDYVQDTSDTDTESGGSDAGLQYEPVTEEEEDAPIHHESSGQSEDEIISTEVIEVSVMERGSGGEEADGEGGAEGEGDESEGSDSELDLHDYWRCAQCHAKNNTPFYRYCQKCFQVRKNFFPPRPKRKSKRTRIEPDINDKVTKLIDQTDSGVDSAFNSQDLSQPSPLVVDGNGAAFNSQDLSQPPLLVVDGNGAAFNSQDLIQPSPLVVDCNGAAFNSQDLSQPSAFPLVVDDTGARHTASSTSGTQFSEANENIVSERIDISNISGNVILNRHSIRKRRTDSTDGDSKRARTDCTDSDSDSCDQSFGTHKYDRDNVHVKPLTKTVSDPLLTIDGGNKIKLTKKGIANSLKEKLESGKEDLCIICVAEPKSGVFVHGRIAHICCCYKCSVKVWAKAKRCPVCNCKVSNVLKAVVM